MVRGESGEEEAGGCTGCDDRAWVGVGAGRVGAGGEGLGEGVCCVDVGEESIAGDLREEAVGGADERPFSVEASLHEPRGDHVAGAGDEAARVEEEEDRRRGGVVGCIVDVALDGDGVHGDGVGCFG